MITRIVLLLLCHLSLHATTWNIGPTRTYKLPSEVVDLVQEIDSVIIDAGTYQDVQCAWKPFGVTFIGNGTVVLRPDPTQVANSTWTLIGGACRIVNLTFRDGLSRTEPGCGVRILGVSCQVDSCAFVRNRRGIDVIETVESSITIRSSFFEDNEDADVNVGGKQSVSMFNCWFGGSANAVNIRSAAAFHYIYCNRFTNDHGSGRSSLEFLAGGYVQLLGNVFRSTGPSDLPRHVITYSAAAQAGSGLPNTLACNWNTLVNDADSISFIELRGAVAPAVEIKNTIVAGNGILLKDITDNGSAVVDSDGNYANSAIASVGFVNVAYHNYHIMGTSPARAIAPAQSVAPIGDEYIHPRSSRVRASWSNIGAFEFDPSTSVSEQQNNNNSIDVAPNPAHTICTLLLPPFLVGTEVVMMNLQGSEVARFTAIQTTESIDVSSLAAGVYIVRCGKHVALVHVLP